MDPVLKRADSVKEIGIQRAISYSSFAAESLDNALTVADGYVNKYLPELPDDSTVPSGPIPGNLVFICLGLEFFENSFFIRIFNYFVEWQIHNSKGRK